MTIRLKGKPTFLGFEKTYKRGGKYDVEVYDANFILHPESIAEIEIPPLSRKPKVGELVLCVGEVYTDELNPIGVRFSGGKIIDGGVVKNIVAIFPRDKQNFDTSQPSGFLGKQKECKCKKARFHAGFDVRDCPIHSTKMKEEKECKESWVCPNCSKEVKDAK